MNTGEKLRSLRKKSGRTLEEQSGLLAVSLNTVYRWEHNLTTPKKAIMTKVGKIYGVSLGWLLTDDDAPDGAGYGASNDQGNALDYAGEAFERDNYADALLIKMIKKLSEHDKYKVLGYIERICVECTDANPI